MEPAREPIDIVLPAHNEGDSIALVLHDFYDVVGRGRGIPIRFLVCEDGSTDNTVAVVRAVAHELPLQLLTSTERKGYSRAVVDGLRASESALVAFIDSDGQCDPADFAGLLDHIDGAGGAHDLVVGYRNPRQDPLHRKVMSRAFKTVYEMLFPVRLRDPSCPYLIIRRPALERILQGDPGILSQGFWWEFNARASAAGLDVAQVPVRHRDRLAGNTKVYRPTRIPGIGAEHLRGLAQLRRELARRRDEPRPAPSGTGSSLTG